MTSKITPFSKIFSLLSVFALTVTAAPSDRVIFNATQSTVATTPWWKTAVIYQVYPRSFKDSNHDGIGDLRGIIAKLDYLKNLGVDTLYMNPHYDSPNVDYGYDVRNYRKVMKEFGTMADFDHLVKELKKRGMRLIIDVVVNHTSDEHPWFKQSRSSLTNRFRDYYFWHSFQPSSLPRNAESIFGGIPWEYDAKTQQFYLHYFTKHQPDLNWDNPQVRQKIYAMLRFWLNKGVAGLRFDSIATISKDTTAIASDQPGNIRTYAHGPYLHHYLQEMHQRVLAHYPDVVSIGEIVGVDNHDIPLFVDQRRQELDISLNIDLLHPLGGPGPMPGEGKRPMNPPLPYANQPPGSNPPPPVGTGPSNIQGAEQRVHLKSLRQRIMEIDQSVGAYGWNNFFLTNHDNPRAVSTFGNDQAYRIDSAKALATLLLTQRGTPIIYQGDEIGMTNYPAHLNNGASSDHSQQGAGGQDRRHSRSPYQWDATAYGGFSTVVPWLAVNPSYRQINAKADLQSTQSIYRYYQTLIEIRRAIPALMLGLYHDLDPTNDDVFAYTRTLGTDTYLVLINVKETPQNFIIPANIAIDHVVIQNPDQHPLPPSQTVTLRPWQSGIYHVKVMN